MADINELKGVFGGIQFDNNNKINNNENNNNNEIDNTSYFGENAENIGNNVFGKFELNPQNEVQNVTENNSTIFQPIAKEQALVKPGIWSKIKKFLFQEIDLGAPIKIHFMQNRKKVEVKNEVNEFSNQKVSFGGIKNWFKGKNQKEKNNIDGIQK